MRPRGQRVGGPRSRDMERHRLTDRAAFDRLVTTSQHRNTKLRDLARRLVETGEDSHLL
ncbi:ANTAR domain-containing protein [Saccharothrix xinjiangensis]|uniref:ANTAR domain-containing protein n=1 Tax=Saccharothrix xinjiangensis TaxID=204798 RepID=A0ABV9XZV7_9PSEU